MNQVITASGLDCVMNFCPPMFYSWSKQSFFSSPIDTEILWTTNANSLGDFNRAKWEFVVKCSPVDLSISKGRIDRIVNIIPNLSMSHPKGGSKAALPPRLE